MNLTERAVAKVKALAERDQVAKILRVGVRGGGCSGMSYFVEFETQTRDTDRVFDYGDLKVVCDPKSYTFLAELEVDYETNLMKAGFKFVNPKAQKTCGCGESFTV